VLRIVDPYTTTVRSGSNNPREGWHARLQTRSDLLAILRQRAPASLAAWLAGGRVLQLGLLLPRRSGLDRH
jgi:hypothetical protein